MDRSTRLNKLIAHKLGVSRRQADDMIAAGRIAVDGQTATLGARTNYSQTVSLDGQTLKPSKPDYTYVALNKPCGYICSRRSQGTPTIYELLPSSVQKLKPVGRLDKDSSGLLLLTDDGDFAHQMTHPKFQKSKSYVVELNQPLSAEHKQAITDGVQLGDGVSRLQLSQTETRADAAYNVTMHEGRNRQIRRTFAALGYTVTKLHRTRFGDYELDDLPPGQHRYTVK